MIRHQTTVSRLGVSALGGIAVAAMMTATPAVGLEIKTSDVHGEGYPTTEAIRYMGDLLSAWTNGRITVNLFPSMQLGGEKEALEQTQLGALEMTRVSVGVVGPIVGEFDTFNLPYFFRSVEHMNHVVDGEIGTDLLNKLEAGGLIGLGYMDGGSRSFYVKDHAITKPADLAGMKIRVMQNPVFVDMVNALGGNGVQIAYNELVPALQTGVVDGAENNPPSMLEQNHYRSAKYYTLTGHLILPEPIVMSKTTWNKLTPEQQVLVKKYAHEAQLEERQLWDEKSASSEAKLKEAGVEFIEIDKKPFYDATAPVREKYGAPYAALIKRIEAVQ